MCVPSGILMVEITSFPTPQSTLMVIAQFPPFGGLSFANCTNEGKLTNQSANDESPFSSNEGLGIRLFSFPGIIIESLHRRSNRANNNNINKWSSNLFFITFCPANNVKILVNRLIVKYYCKKY